MEHIRWLDDEEQRTWRAFVEATRRLFSQFDRELRSRAGMPLSYYEILVFLSEAPGRSMRMSDLAQAAQSSPSRVSHAVTKLEHAGWVQRQSCPTDRRGWHAVLTDEGLAALEAAALCHVEGVRAHLFDQLSASQLGQLRDISERLRSHLWSEGAELSDPNHRTWTSRA